MSDRRKALIVETPADVAVRIAALEREVVVIMMRARGKELYADWVEQWWNCQHPNCRLFTR